MRIKTTVVTALAAAVFASPACAVTLTQHPGMTAPVLGTWSIMGIIQRVGNELQVHSAIAYKGAVQYVFPLGDNPVAELAEVDAALWTPDPSTGGAIDRYVPGGGLTRFPVHYDPVDVVPGPEGNLWFTDAWPFIGRMTPNGEVTEYPLPTMSQPYGIVLGPDYAFWFTEADAIGRITTSGALEQFPLPPVPHPSGEQPDPQNITVGPEGDLWFTDPGDDSIGRVTMAGQVTEYRIPLVPQALRVLSTYAGATPETITSSGGLLWVSEENVRGVLSVNPNGQPQPSGKAAHHGRRPSVPKPLGDKRRHPKR